MSDNITAERLMLTVFSEIRADQFVYEAMRALVEVQAAPDVPSALVVVDAEGRYEGVMTARLLFKSLLTLWMPTKRVREDDELLGGELIEVVADRAKVAVHDALIRGLPVADPADRLLKLILLSCDQELEYVAVVDGGRAVGLVPVTEIFKATASIALTPEDEGIQL